MPSNVRVVDQKFFAKLNNGDSYSLNPSDFSRHLKGGVTEEIKAVFNVQVEWYVVLSSYNYLYDSVGSTLRIEKDGLDFKANGFSIGDSAKLSQAGSNPKISGDVTSLSVGEMILENVSIDSGTLSSGYYTDALGGDPLTGTTPLTALNYKFGLIENDESFNTLSKLTNTDQGYLVDGIDHGVPLTFASGLSQGNNKAWVTGSLTCAFVGLSPDKDYNLNQDTTQEFQIEHTFVINPDYRDGELDSLEGTDTPPEDIFEGDRSLKYVFQTEFRTTLNNPNTSKIFDYDTQLGSVGYYGESYNGFPNNYSVDALVYDIGGDTVNELSIGEVTNVAFDILSSDSTFTASTPVLVGHKSIIDSLSYSNSPNDYNTLWTNESLRTNTVDAPISGTLIKNYKATFVNSGKISIVFDIEFTNPQTRILNDGQNYVLYYTVADPSKTVDTGDKVTNRIDVNVYEKNGDISGLFDVETLEQYPLPYEFEKGVSTGFTSGKMFVEDEQFCYARIKVLNTYLGEDLDLLEDVTLDSLKFKIVAYNTVENTWFDIRTLNIDLTDEILSGNIQNIQLDTTRGYILTDTDIFNSLKVTTDNNDGTWQYYDVEIGYKIPWQSWLELVGADTVFLDRSQSQNNLNQNASTYSFTNNYVIRFLIDAEVETTGITTNYVGETGDFLAYDYNTDDQNPDAFSCVINTYNSDGVVLQNKIIEKGYTEFRAIVTPEVPLPPFTQSVDFTEVDNLWNRFAHSNLQDLGVGGPTGAWVNNQSKGLTDIPLDLFSPSLNKDDANLYTSTINTISANQNGSAVYGCFSLLKYEFYAISGKMFSTDSDNDQIIYDIVFNVGDTEEAIESKISLIATTGGIGFYQNPAYNAPDRVNTIYDYRQPPISARWALVYNFGKNDSVVIRELDTGKSGYNWNSAAVGDLTFEVSRTANILDIHIDWTINGVNFGNGIGDDIQYDLNSNPYTTKFLGLQNIGFSFQSQAGGGFKNVDLSLPDSDYYAALRIEPKEGSSDFGISELNTVVENTEDSLLMQIDGTENKAKLSYDGTDFIVQGLINTSKIIDGEEYKFSAEVRAKNLIV